MKNVESKTFIDESMIKKEALVDFNKTIVLCGGDVGDSVECNLTCTASPPEKQTLEYSGCDASIEDLYIYIDEIEITEIIEKDQLENIEIEIWEELVE